MDVAAFADFKKLTRYRSHGLPNGPQVFSDRNNHFLWQNRCFPNMTQTRPGLTFALTAFAAACCAIAVGISPTNRVFAQDEKKSEQPGTDSEKAKGESADSASKLMEQARKKIGGYESVKADLVQAFSIGGSRFRAVGTYLQGTDNKVRLEYKLEELGERKTKANDTPPKTKTKTKSKAKKINSMTQVSDGEVMYTLMTINGEVRQANRINVKDVQSKVQAMAGKSFSRWLQDFGMGGVKSMLASFEKTMKFGDRQVETLDGEDFIRLTGTWKADERRRMVGEGADPEQPLPGYIPDYVRLYLHPENMFPRRVMYLKRHPTERKVRPMVTLDFVNAVINGPVESSAFALKNLPEKVTLNDVTERVIKQLQSMSKPPAGAGALAPKEK